MTRTNQVLAGVAAVQLALVAWNWWPREAALAEPTDLVGFGAAAIDGIDIEGRMQPGGDAPATLSLKKQGESWVVASASDYPADAAKVTELLDKVGSIQVRSPVATRKESHGSLNVGDDDHARRITLRSGDKSVDLVLGAGTGSAVHVRQTGQDAVYAVRGWTAYAVGDQPSRFWDGKLLALDATTIDSLTVHNPNGSFTLERNPEGNWTAAGEEHPIDKADVDGLVGRLTNLRLSEVVGTNPTPDLGQQTRVEWTTATGDQTVDGSLLVGATADHKTQVQVAGSRWVVRVSSSSVERWESVTLAELRADTPPN